MLGAIAGDIIGSVYEWNNIKTTKFPLFTETSRFTDDTVLTVAVADCILNKKDYAKTLKEYARRYPNVGYGPRFMKWVSSDSLAPYNSFGNGSAMRVGHVGFAFNDIKDVLHEAKKSAEATHNHPEGVKGARAVAYAVLLARLGVPKEFIKKHLELSYGYDLSQRLDDIRQSYEFDETCQGTVPQALIAFLESDSYEDAVRKAISIGGDSDTIACIAGGIAQAYYKIIPDHIVQKVREMLPPELLDIVDAFNYQYNIDVAEGGKRRASRGNCMEPLPAFPTDAKQLNIEGAYTTEEYINIMRGYIPSSMDERWFIYWERDWAYFHRSWTLCPIYKVNFEKTGARYRIKEAWANNEQKKFGGLNVEEAAQTLEFLIGWLVSQNIRCGKARPKK